MRLTLLSLYLLVVVAPLRAQERSVKISGTITDIETGEGIGFCLVGIAGSSLGSITQDSGAFVIENLTSRPYKLVISHVGYEERVISIYPKADRLNLRIQLKPKIIETGEVMVSAGSKRLSRKRARELEEFRKMILGSNYQVQLISILNEEEIENRVLLEESDTPSKPMQLEISNNYLGYNLEYINFKYVMSRKLRWFQGVTRFKELEGTSEEIAVWETNRRDVYKGSLRHFFRSLIANRLDEEGFIASVTNSIPNSFTPSYFIKESSDIEVNFNGENKRGNVEINYDPDKNYFTVSFREAIEVYYADDTKAMDKSIIVLKNKTVRVYASGELVDPLEIRIFGVYAQRGIYEMLPFNYEPKSNE